MNPLSDVAPDLLVIQILIQAMWFLKLRKCCEQTRLPPILTLFGNNSKFPQNNNINNFFCREGQFKLILMVVVAWDDLLQLTNVDSFNIPNFNYLHIEIIIKKPKKKNLCTIMYVLTYNYVEKGSWEKKKKRILWIGFFVRFQKLIVAFELDLT